jgi:hypothetical protein
VSPAPAQAACSQYGFSGPTEITQSNGWKVSFSADGTWVPGTQANTNSGAETDTGWITGSVYGSQVNFRINWAKGSIGIYSGHVNSSGIADDTTFDETNPDSSATWRVSNVNLQCMW